MYNLDYNTSITTMSDGDCLSTLQATGYLQSVPEDPGSGQTAGKNYHMDSCGFVYCSIHGYIQAGAG